MALPKFYQDLALTKEQTNELQSEFVGIETLIKMAWDFLKKNLVRGFIKPTLWQIVVVFLPLLLISGATIGSFIISIKDTIANDGVFNAVNNTGVSADTANQIVRNIGVFGIFSLAFVFFLVLSALISYRAIYLLNNKSIDSIWKTPTNFVYPFFKIIVVGIIYGTISLVIQGIFGAINDGLVIVALLLQYLLIPFVKMSTYIYVLEDGELVDTFKKTWNYIKPYYLSNLLRWLIVWAAFFVLYIGFWLTSLLFVFIAFAVNSIAFSILLSVVGAVILIGLILSFGFYVESLTYLSNLNIRLLEGKKE
jgi:hypothetical protein